MADDVADARPSLFLATRMKRLAERMQVQTMRVIQASGLPIQPSNVLTLAILNEHGAQTIGSIAAYLKVAQPTVTRAVAGLVNEGVVTLGRGEDDQRKRLVSLTPYGRDIWQRAERDIWRPLEEAVEAMLSGMNCDLLEGLIEVEREIAYKSMDQRVRERKASHPTTDRDA